MKLTTLQNRRVLDAIEINEEYIPQSEYNMMEEYEEMFEQYEKQTKIKLDSEIWAWHTFEYERMNKIPKEHYINDIQNFYYNSNKDITLLLEAPDDEVMLFDAYAWSSYVSDTVEERIKNPYRCDEDIKDNEEIENIQVISLTIKKEYVIEYREINEKSKIMDVKWK